MRRESFDLVLPLLSLFLSSLFMLFFLSVSYYPPSLSLFTSLIPSPFRHLFLPSYAPTIIPSSLPTHFPSFLLPLPAFPSFSLSLSFLPFLPLYPTSLYPPTPSLFLPLLLGFQGEGEDSCSLGSSGGGS